MGSGIKAEARAGEKNKQRLVKEVLSSSPFYTGTSAKRPSIFPKIT